MIGQDIHEVERKVISILKVLNESTQPLGARIIARELKEYGVDLTERAVRYHLKIMDERGLTQPIDKDGRVITKSGKEELENALVTDKVGFVITKIELLAFSTSFDLNTGKGQVVINVSFFPKDRFPKAIKAMKDVFHAGLCVSHLVATANEQERLGGILVPEGMVGFATVCSITINGALLKAGVPMDSKFGGILQIRNSQPLRFAELINYEGSTLDPSEIFIRGKMTAVAAAGATGNGKILANFREIPAQCKTITEEVITKLRQKGIGGVMMMGDTSEPVCEIPIGLNRIGIIFLGGLNPVAAAVETGIETENKAMAGVIDYSQLIDFWEL